MSNKYIDNGDIDTDPVCETDLFKKLKLDIGMIQFDYLKLTPSIRSSFGCTIEANPATHRIAKYVYNHLNDEINGWIVMFYGALHELVKLKEIKDTKGKTDDYLERQPKAWYLAQEAIELWMKSDYGALPFPKTEHGQEKEGWQYAPNVHHESGSPTYTKKDKNGFSIYATAEMIAASSPTPIDTDESLWEEVQETIKLFIGLGPSRASKICNYLKGQYIISKVKQ